MNAEHPELPDNSLLGFARRLKASWVVEGGVHGATRARKLAVAARRRLSGANVPAAMFPSPHRDLAPRVSGRSRASSLQSCGRSGPIVTASAGSDRSRYTGVLKFRFHRLPIARGGAHLGTELSLKLLDDHVSAARGCLAGVALQLPLRVHGEASRALAVDVKRPLAGFVAGATWFNLDDRIRARTLTPPGMVKRGVRKYQLGPNRVRTRRCSRPRNA